MFHLGYVLIERESGFVPIKYPLFPAFSLLFSIIMILQFQHYFLTTVFFLCSCLIISIYYYIFDNHKDLLDVAGKHVAL